MITVEQIRAARAMLNWPQRQLAAAAGLSMRSLQSIETSMSVPRMDTIRAIKSALEKAGIEFTETCTVTLRHEIFDTEKREGTAALESLIFDFMEAYRLGTKELLLCNTMEKKWFEATSPATSEEYHKALIRYGVTERCLIAHGDTINLGFPSLYRWMPKENFSEVSYAVYGSTLALIIWHPVVRIVIIRNAAIAESYRRHFEFIWKRAKIPPFARKKYSSGGSPENGAPIKKTGRLSRRAVKQ